MALVARNHQWCRAILGPRIDICSVGDECSHRLYLITVSGYMERRALSLEEEEEEEEGEEEEEAMMVVLSRLLIALVSSRARSSRAISTSPPAMVADTLLYHLIFGQRIALVHWN